MSPVRPSRREILKGAAALGLGAMLMGWAVSAWAEAPATPASMANKPWGTTFAGVLHDEKNIKGFVEEDKWLSNFFPCRVQYEGLGYGSSEAAYQAGKFPATEREPYTKLVADAAKKLAHSKTVDEAAWDARKARVMREVVWIKFSQNPELAEKLLATGDKYLEETNWWSDAYWGVCNGVGQNMLGRILMETRLRLRQAGSPPLVATAGEGRG